MINNRLQILYQKTDFNNHKICQLPGIFKCSKCKKNNSVMIDQSLTVQLCLFCGMPNQVIKNIDTIKNIK
jgi:hypothetical protein